MFFEHVYSFLWVLKIWGVLAWFGDILDEVLLCKWHKLNIYMKLTKNEANSIIYGIKENDGPQKMRWYVDIYTPVVG